MARDWDAEFEISAEVAARLIDRQFPALAPAKLSTLGVGWDNVAFLVDGRFVFRFPRRPIAVELIERESQVLPVLAPHLPFPIPAPEHIGIPSEDYPYPFAGYALIPGITACRHTWSGEDRARTAAPLARFLAALHGIPVDDRTLAWAPRDDIGRADMKKRVPRVKERLGTIAPQLGDLNAMPLLELVDRLASSPPRTEAPRWIHGDLYARHVLVDESHRLCGVIDWGDVHLGDTALDLSIAWSFLPASARDAFREEYGPIDDATWNRARFRAIHYGAMLITYGAGIGDDAIRTAGEYALRAAGTCTN